MPAFIVQVHDPAGADGALRRVRQVQVQADSAQGVSAALGLHPAQVLSVRAMHQVSPGAGPGIGQRPRAGIDLRLFSQELAVLLEAGIPLLESLQTLHEKDDGGRGSVALDAVIGALRDGLPVSAALGTASQAFDALFIALVAASERSGQLTATLRHHAAYLAWRDALQSRLRAALVYPLMLLAAGGAVIMFLLLYVLPRFAGVFDGLGRELPLASRWLIDLGVLAAAHPLAALGLALTIALALPLAALLAWRLPASRAALPALLWRLPGLGGQLRLVALARLYRVLGLLLSAGVPAPSGLPRRWPGAGCGWARAAVSCRRC